jgi:hypothetical protein
MCQSCIMKSPEEQAADRKEIDSSIKQIRAWINSGAPDGHSGWSYQKSVEFNDAVKQGLSICKSMRPTIQKVRSIYSRLKEFYQ